jgi:hypothetical protein
MRQILISALVVCAGLMSSTSYADPVRIFVGESFTLEAAADTGFDYLGSSIPRSAVAFDYLTLSGFDSSLGTLLNVRISVGGFYRITNTTEGRDLSPRDDETNVVARTLTTARLSAQLAFPTGASGSTGRVDVHENQCSSAEGSCSETTSTGGYVINQTIPILPLDVSFFARDIIQVFVRNEVVTQLRDPGIFSGCSTFDQCRSMGQVTWTGSVSATYDYEPFATSSVPEPATLGLLGIGLLGIGLTRRRRQA